MQASDYSYGGIALLMVMAVACAALIALIDRRMLRRLLNVTGLSTAQMLVLGLCAWGAYVLDRWWVSLLWLLLSVGVVSWFSIRSAHLQWRTLIVPTATGVTLASIILLGCLMLCFRNTHIFPLVGALMASLQPSVTQVLSTYVSSKRHTEAHRRFLLASGATPLEALMPSIRRAVRAAVLPQLKQMDAPIAVCMPLLFCGMLIGGAHIASTVVTILLLWMATFAASVVATIAIIWVMEVKKSPVGRLEV